MLGDDLDMRKWHACSGDRRSTQWGTFQACFWKAAMGCISCPTWRLWNQIINLCSNGALKVEVWLTTSRTHLPGSWSGRRQICGIWGSLGGWKGWKGSTGTFGGETGKLNGKVGGGDEILDCKNWGRYHHHPFQGGSVRVRVRESPMRSQIRATCFARAWGWRDFTFEGDDRQERAQHEINAWGIPCWCTEVIDTQKENVMEGSVAWRGDWGHEGAMTAKARSSSTNKLKIVKNIHI